MSSPRRILVAYSMASTFVQTTLDYLHSFKRFGEGATQYVHVTHDAVMAFDFDSYDVVFHNYCARLCYDWLVSDSYRDSLRNFSGVKILAVQDEYDHTDALKAAIIDLGFDIVLTCVPQDSLEYVYPRSEFPSVEFLTVFTGYVSDDFAAAMPPVKPLADRPIGIGYRGRDIGGRYGRLGFDKFEVGRRTKELCDARGIATDIAMDEQSRIYGTAWFDFLGDCRAMLGSESGSNVFDFDGSIDARFKEMTAKNGGRPPSYSEFQPYVAKRDAEIEMGQISPRVFECAVMRTPMVLFRGRYSDAIQPDRHYIALEKDFSNFDEVLARLDDLPGLEAMTQRAFDDLVGSGAFGYRAFHQRLNQAIERLAITKPKRHLASAKVAGERQQELLPWTLNSLVETATDQPGSLDKFKERQELRRYPVYVDEYDRLIREFDDVRSRCTVELRRLSDVYLTQRAKLLDAGKAGAALAATYPEVLPAPALHAFLGAYQAEIAGVPDDRELVQARYRAAVGNRQDAAAVAAARAMVAFEQDGFNRMIEHFRVFNEIYGKDRSLLDARIELITAAVLSARLGMRINIVPRRFISAARAVVGHSRRWLSRRLKADGGTS